MIARIKLSKWNRSGSMASIVSEDGMNDVVLSCKRSSQDGPAMCHAAAKILRTLADKFEALAATEEPFKETTQQQFH